jgi:NTP pyrophosphatase (non-canonical NTP hydrolase)
MTSFEEYQSLAHTTARYDTDCKMKVGVVRPNNGPSAGIPKVDFKDVPVYPFLKSTAEAAETLDKVVKVRFRGDAPGYLMKDDLVKEIGDDLWYIAERCTVLGVSMEEVARINLEKLASRNARGVIHGSGDNR